MIKNYVNAILRTVASVSMFLAAGTFAATTTVNLTAQRATASMPDGSSVPMWQFCGGACPAVAPGAWTPGPTITVPVGDTLTINLTNALNVPTSIVVLGQLGGGLGQGTRMPSPAHPAQNFSTFVGNAAAGPFTPPAQADRVKSFGSEVPPGNTTPVALTWNNLKPGTYIYEAGTLPSLQVPMGLYGLLIVTQAPKGNPNAIPSTFVSGSAYPSSSSVVSYDSDVALLFSEVDPVQNAQVDAAAQFGTRMEANLRFNDSSCVAAGLNSTNVCYPAAVNYTPTFFLINGRAFDKTQPQYSAFAVPATYSSGKVLLRLANAGSLTHIPSFIGMPMSLAAEDGNVLPGNPRVQNEVLLTAGKVYDVLVSPSGTVAAGYTPGVVPFFDRRLNTTSANQVDGGMQGFLQIAGGALPSAVVPTAVDDIFQVPLNTAINGNVKINDIAVAAVALGTGPTNGVLTALNPDGTFVYTPNTGFNGTDTFTYSGNGGTASCSSGSVVVSAPCLATVTLKVAASGLGVAPTAVNDTYTSSIATKFTVSRPGVLGNDNDPGGYLLTASLASAGTCGSVTMSPDGSFTATSGGNASCQFTYVATNSQGTSSSPATVTVTFLPPNAKTGLSISVIDAKNPAVTITDYRWTLQEDQNYPIDPTATPSPSKRTLSTGFYWSHMPVVATGCVGAVSCGSGQSVRGVTITDAAALAKQTLISDIAFDPNKRYYISILPGDAANPSGGCDSTVYPFCVGGGGHIMGGASITANNLADSLTYPVVIRVQPTPIQPAQTNFFVYEDNNPTNGQYDLGERGLGGFEIILNDTAGRAGDVAGQQTYDAFNMPMTNALLGTPGCPDDQNPNNPKKDPVGGNLVGAIYTCPNDPNEGTSQADPVKYALAGHAVIKNITPARYDIYAKVGAEREHNHEQWIQVETLEGTAAIDDFVPGRDAAARNPANFVWGMPGFQNTVGFVNPDRIKQYAQTSGLVGSGSISGRVTLGHDGRAPDVTIYDSNSRGMISGTPCQVALNSDQGGGPTIAYAACDADGNFKLNNVPAGAFSIAVWDQWLDQVIQQVQVTVTNGVETKLGNIPVPAWFTYMTQNIFIDLNGNGVRDSGEPGILNVPLGARYRNGAPFTQTLTDGTGNGTMTEVAPLLNWVVFEADTTRYKQTGVEVIVDAGGPLTGNDISGVYRATPTNPIHCDPTGGTLPALGSPCSAANTTRYLDTTGTVSFGVQGAAGQTNTLNWGRAPYATNENGGIVGTVVYSSTRPFDDQRLDIQTIWEPLIPRVTVNLYRKDKLADGSDTLTLVDTTQTTSFDDWANLVSASDGNQYILGTDNVLRVPGTGQPAPAGVTGSKQVNMQCPGQVDDDPLLTSSLMTQSGTVDQFRCYDGAHNWNQVQKAPYDGRYQFPSPTYIAAHQADLGTCNSLLTNGQRDPVKCKTLVSLQPGQYVVEAVTPPGYEIVKEEDKNILIGDAFTAPVTSQFGSLSSIFILPDQAVLNNANPYNPNTGDPGVQSNPTTNLGVTGAGVAFPECVGTPHRVPDYLSLYPQAAQVAPFAGMDRPLCDRKLVKLGDQMQATANFFMFTPVQGASNGAGVVTDDTAAQFSVGSPTFGDKGTLSFAAVSIRDFTGMEVVRTYADQWGYFNLMTPSSWLVNPPTPSGFGPNMLITCMNDPGPIYDPLSKKWVTDPQYDPAYMNSCYPLPFMPMQTTFLDTPTLPKAAFAAGYNPADCEYPDSYPAIQRVDSSAGVGPYLPNGGGTLTIQAPGDTEVQNPGWTGPLAIAGDPSSLRKIKRHYGFGNSAGSIKIGSNTIPAGNITSWTDATITVQVPGETSSGQLVVTTAAGKSTVEAVMVTIGGTAPKRVPSASYATIQAAVDAAVPGDLIIIDAGSYNESVIMWKPVRLQGVGARSVFINSAKFPVGPMEAWEINVNKLFGVDPVTQAVDTKPAQVDPLPGQSLTGGIALLSPTVLTNVEGPGITVLAKNLSAAQCTGGALSGWGSPVTDSNFRCHPSRIDGVSVIGSEGGGGIYVNGWAHNLEISNNRVFSNASPFFGGIGIGQPYLGLTALPTNTNGSISGLGYDINVSIHNNSISKNGAIQPQGAGDGGAGGGVSIAAGSDNYSVDHNFVCGNFTQADGGGIGQVGYSRNGSITNNTIVFNQSFQQTTITNGGGIAVVGEAIGGGSPSLGTGSLTIDANLIRGNIAETGSGGGISLAQVNGGDVALHPSNTGGWFSVTITNNMIDDNVAGLSGGGISLVDALNVSILNNTVSHNDSIGTVGGTSQTRPGPAGISSIPTSPELAAVSNRVSAISKPTLTNDIIWRNRSFYFDQTGFGRLCSSNDVADTSCRQLVWQGTTGQCMPTSTAINANGTAAGETVEAKYWDLGVVGDANAANPGTNKLAPRFSVLTSTAGYNQNQSGNISTNPGLVQEYCNGSRTTPEFALPNDPGMARSLQVAQSSGEGGNAVNVRFGPLTMAMPTTSSGTGAPYLAFGDYHIVPNSSAIDAGTNVPVNHDFDGQPRPIGTAYDIGADEVSTVAGSVSALAFAPQQTGTTSSPQQVTITNNGVGSQTINSITLTGTNSGNFTPKNNCGTLPANLAAGASCTISVTFTPSNTGARGPATLRVSTTAGQTTVTLTGTGVAPADTALPTPLAFGTVTRGSSSTAQTVTVTNTGVGPLILAAPAFSLAGSNPAEYSAAGGATGAPCSNNLRLAVGAACTIDVKFTPTRPNGTGSKPATLRVFSNATTKSVSLTGTAN